MNLKFFGAAVAGAALLAGAAHANLLTNGGFESGDFTGWTLGGNTGSTGVTCCGFNNFNGQGGSTYFAALGPIGSDGTLSQTFTDHAGYLYVSSFWIGSDGGTPNDFGVTGPGGLTLTTINDYPSTNGSYVHYVGYFIGSGSDTITFTYRNDPGYFALDTVAVTSAVPEPAAWALMTLGLGALGGALRTRRKAAPSAA